MRLFPAALLFASMFGAVAACGTILTITPDDAGAGAGDAAADTTNAEGGRPEGDGGVDAEPPWAPCTPMVTSGIDDARLCAPRYFAGAVTSGGDAASPFLTGAYTFDANNAGFEDTPPCTQVTSFFISWDASFLHFFGRMTDPMAVRGHDGYDPGIEAMLCVGDPDGDYDEAHCVDFIVEYTGKVKGPFRFDTTRGEVKGSADGGIRDFTVTATVPAKDFGGLVSGMHMMVNVNGISFVPPSMPTQRNSVSAFSIPNRTCKHDAGSPTSNFTCGANDQSYEPERWARMILE